MRHVTRRKHRVRRARLTRRRLHRKQQRGGALGNTEALTKWLRKVFDRYTKFGQTADPNRTFNERNGGGVEFSAIIDPENSEAISFDKDMDTKYIMPLEIQPIVVMPSDKEIDSYDLKGNFGRVIRFQVLELSSAQEGQVVSQMSTMRFSSSVEYMMTDPGLYPVEELLKTENILRGILRADIIQNNDKDPNLTTYKHIAEDITSLSDVNTYPLYVWAVALNIDAQGADQGLTVPMLSQETIQTGPAQPAGQ